MSETHNKTHQAPVIERNGVMKTLTKTAFGKKSNNAGVEFYYPVTSTEALLANQDELTWYGDALPDAVNKICRLIFGDLKVEHTKDGVFNEAAWALDAADFTAGAAKLSDLQEEVDRLNDVQAMYVSDPRMEGTDEEQEEISKLIKDIANQIKPLRIKIKDIKAKYEARAAKREAKPVVAAA